MMSEKPRAPLADDAFTLPAHYYTDPDHYRAEMTQFFGRRWVYLAHVDQVRDAGDFLVREVDGESLIVARGDDGVVRAYYNVCRHRGTRLCLEERGRFHKTIQCPYHAWTYDLSGRLVGAPHMEDLAHFRREDWPLQQVNLDEWDGLIFGHFGDSEGSLHDQLGDLPTKLAPWRMQDLHLVHRSSYEVKANWKLIIQNYSECLHCPVIHPQLQRLSHYLSGENDPPHRGYLGGRMDLRPGVDSMTRDGRTDRGCLPSLSEVERRQVAYYAVIPNLLLSLHPDYVLTHSLWPRECGQTQIECNWYVHPNELSRPGFDLSDAIDFWHETNRQDWEVSERSQLGIGSRAYTPGPYSSREDLLYAFDRLVRAEMESERNGG